MQYFRKIITKYFLLGLLVLVLASAAVYQIFFSIPPLTVVLKEDGWHPESIVIEPGETVTFKNQSKNAFWPASNSHPQHNLYTEFDTGHPVGSGESWSFAFLKPGAWGFHDHLRSFYTGTVYVGKEAQLYDCAEHLASLDIAEKRDCWDGQMLSELRTNGAAAAFRLFATLYDSDPDFTVLGCHSIAHKIGDTAYGEYLRYGKNLSQIQFPPESVYCGYGYYHGVLEHMIRDNPDFSAADKFCRMLAREYETEIPRIRLNCYHAIGHGFVPEPTDVEAWGNASRMMAPSIAACRNIKESDARVECLQGTFNVIGVWMWNNQFGLTFPKSDSLALCRSFEDSEVSNACYYELSMNLLPFANGDLVKVYNLYAASIEDDEIAGMVMNSAAAGVLGVNIAQDDFISFLKDCRALPQRVEVDCLKGLTGGFIAHGEPEKEYVKAIAFCSNSELTPDEKETCYENIIRTFKGAYTKEKVADVCRLVESSYRKYCVYE